MRCVGLEDSLTQGRIIDIGRVQNIPCVCINRYFYCNQKASITNRQPQEQFLHRDLACLPHYRFPLLLFMFPRHRDVILLNICHKISPALYCQRDWSFWRWEFRISSMNSKFLYGCAGLDEMRFLWVRMAVPAADRWLTKCSLNSSKSMGSIHKESHQWLLEEEAGFENLKLFEGSSKEETANQIWHPSQWRHGVMENRRPPNVKYYSKLFNVLKYLLFL